MKQTPSTHPKNREESKKKEKEKIRYVLGWDYFPFFEQGERNFLSS